jgi:hypothetical protein
MREGTPFEGYPGAPGRDDATYRVISPWRDALAWVSIAGPLAVVGYLVRDGEGWREVVPGNTITGPGELDWVLAWRDPVDLVFQTTTDGVEATARVAVARAACEIRVDAGANRARVLGAIAIPREAAVEQGEGGHVLLRMEGTWPTS